MSKTKSKLDYEHYTHAVQVALIKLPRPRHDEQGFAATRNSPRQAVDTATSLTQVSAMRRSWASR
jgi:hypothetical protein